PTRRDPLRRTQHTATDTRHNHHKIPHSHPRHGCPPLIYRNGREPVTLAALPRAALRNEPGPPPETYPAAHRPPTAGVSRGSACVPDRGGWGGRPQRRDGQAGQAVAEAERLGAAVEHEARVKLRAEPPLQQSQTAEVVGPYGFGSLDLHPHDPAGIVLEYSVHF